MKFIHTSDWHLGVTINRQPCDEEQRRFLSWLTNALEERSCEALIVAGDVFHYANPSNSAQKLYYDFLLDCSRNESLRKVIIVGGNHDSPSGLDAPRELLDRLDVHVVGGLPGLDKVTDTCLCPVVGSSGEVELVVAAVPYVQEARLGVSNRSSGSDLRGALSKAFQDLYAQLATEAKRRWPNATLVATGHLTCYGSEKEHREEDFHTHLHRVGSESDETEDSEIRQERQARRIGGLHSFSPNLFGEAYDYVALGHIHRCFETGPNIWYSGTPTATSKTENSTRFILEVDCHGTDGVDVSRCDVPRWRNIWTIAGETDDLVAQAEELEAETKLPAYVFVDAQIVGDEPLQRPLERVRAVLEQQFDENTRPIIADYKPVRVDLERRSGSTAQHIDPTHADPLDIFRQLYREKLGSEPKQKYIDKFNSLLEEVREAERGTEQSSSESDDGATKHAAKDPVDKNTGEAANEDRS